MMQACGLDPEEPQRHILTVDSATWSACPRRRILLSTLPTPQELWQTVRRSTPWEHGWQPHPQGSAP
eukprot:12933450-Prorocentrum_lima.AAC.1